MREVEYRTSSHRSRYSSRSKSRERDRHRDRDYYSRRKRSRSHSKRKSKSKKKKSKKKYYRRSPSTSSRSSSCSSSRSRESVRSHRAHHRPATSKSNRQRSSAEKTKPVVVQTAKPLNLPDAIPEKSVLDEIDKDSFTPKTFFSSTETKKLPEKVIINLDSDTISVEGGKVEDPEPEEAELIHPDFLGDYQQKLEQWTKKLFNYRQKMFQK